FPAASIAATTNANHALRPKPMCASPRNAVVRPRPARETGRRFQSSQESVMVPRVNEHEAVSGAPRSPEERTLSLNMRLVLVSSAVLALVAGCSGDIAGELSRNVQVRDRVMGAIAADSSLAREMTQRLLGSDRQ